MCTAFRLLGGGSDTACPREGPPSHVSQFGDIYRVGSEGDAGQMDFGPNKSELGLAWRQDTVGHVLAGVGEQDSEALGHV